MGRVAMFVLVTPPHWNSRERAVMTGQRWPVPPAPGETRLPRAGGRCAQGWLEDKIPADRDVLAVAAGGVADAPLRCVIVDDNANFLDVASILLQREGISVIGVASAIADALQKVAELRPEAVLIDITLGHESGFDLARRLATMDSRPPAIILISTHAEEDFADLIEEAPVAGFVAKRQLTASAIQRLTRE
jgi:CheY-like chemotaxis protein